MKHTRQRGENVGTGFIDSAGGSKLSEYLVSRSQLGPRLVSSPIVILGICDFHVLVETQDFSGLQLCDRGSLTQLQETVVTSLYYSANETCRYLLWMCYFTFLVSRRLISLTSACLSAWFLAVKQEEKTKTELRTPMNVRFDVNREWGKVALE